MTSKERDAVFATLYDQYRDMVFQLCLGYMKGDREQAHDLSQEVFINCWQALDKFRGGAAYKTWVYRITVNTCLQYLRYDLRRRRVPLAEDLVLAAPSPTPTAPYQALYQAIGQLNEVDRIVVMLTLEELSYAEISDITGLAEGTLRVRIHRAKKSLKKLLRHEQTE